MIIKDGKYLTTNFEDSDYEYVNPVLLSNNAIAWLHSLTMDAVAEVADLALQKHLLEIFEAHIPVEDES